MHVLIDTSEYLVTGEKQFEISKCPTKVKDFYKKKSEYRELLEEFQEEINDLQRMMYAHDRYSLLLIFQAMDAAGKDGTIRAIMSGVNAHGITVHPFKQPSAIELDHDFLWRSNILLPSRGRIGIFNRSYYEEVLIVRVHPEIIQQSQKLPEENSHTSPDFWKHRYESIRDHEKHLWRNGTKVIKFFLNLSRDEQRDRFLDRIDEPEKNWKFSESDVSERKYWDDYQRAYEEAINGTATKHAPWYVVPADDKKNMRLIVAQAILNELKSLNIHYPVVSEERRKELDQYREKLLKD